MERVMGLPSGFTLWADMDCSPWITDTQGARYRPHELMHWAGRFLGPLQSEERRLRSCGAPQKVIAAVVNAKVMLERAA